MENKDNFDELNVLKHQMAMLKRQLGNERIINDEQVEKITKQFHPRKAKKLTIFAILSCLVACLNILQIYIWHRQKFAIWEIILGILIMLFLFYLYVIKTNQGMVICEIVDEQLHIRNRFERKPTLIIPISSIRFIERLANPHSGRTIRIMYNKFDDIYLDPKNLNDFICDLIRINPDIELRNE